MCAREGRRRDEPPNRAGFVTVSSVAFLLAQLSDPHIGAAWTDDDPSPRFQRCLAAATVLRPDALIVTGDLAEHGATEEYAELRVALSSTGIPFHVLPGNHDDRERMRAAFGLPGEGAQPIEYAVDLGPVTLVVLDTTIPSEDGGELGEQRLRFLAGALGSAPAKPIVVAFHHPPVRTGVPPLDRLALPDRDGDALRHSLGSDERVALLLAGHLHRPIRARLGPHPLHVAPSTYLQARLGFDLTELEFTDEPPGFAVHVLDGAGVVSHSASA
jgi:3',5'-cyclic AMP phosphodiesterase CpdA